MYILASASARRKELFKTISEDFLIVPSLAEEIIDENCSIFEIAQSLAAKKALEVFKRYPEDIVIGGDTTVIIENKIFGKPQSKAEAKQMLLSLSNTVHQVVTGVCVISKNKIESFSSISDVEFYSLSEKEIDDYLEDEEYVDKAGAYAIQGKGKFFIKRINGDYNSIIGLPIAELKRRLKNF